MLQFILLENIIKKDICSYSYTNGKGTVTVATTVTVSASFQAGHRPARKLVPIITGWVLCTLICIVYYFDTSQAQVNGPQNEVKAITLTEKRSCNVFMMILNVE